MWLKLIWYYSFKFYFVPAIYEIEDIWVFQCKIEFYFTEWTPQAVFSRVAVAASVEIPIVVFMSEVKFSLTLKKSNFLFL